MTTRRQLLQSFLATMAALALQSGAWALSPFAKPQSLPEYGKDAPPSTLNEDCTGPTRIKVVGVGGSGCNAVDTLMTRGFGKVPGLELICANTDAQSLSRSRVHKNIQLGESGLGTGGRVDLGRQATEGKEAEIRATLAGTDLLFVIAGLGGGTGSGAAPVLARLARDMGILTVGLVTQPFGFEGEHCLNNATVGSAELEAHADALILVPNDKLLDVLGEHATQEEAFAHVDAMLANIIGGIAEILNVPSSINVDFEDLRWVLGESGKVMMGTAVAVGAERARIAAEQALASPWLAGMDISGAQNAVAIITASKSSLMLSESKLVMNIVRFHVGPDAHVIYGTNYDDSLNDEIRVTFVATGFPSERG
jgi:cell division protein FtsZ